MDKGTYDEVAAMVGAASEEGLTLSNLEDVREAALASAPLMAGVMLRAIVCTLEMSASGGTLTPFFNCEQVYVKFKMGDVAEDWSKITGNALPARAPDGPAQAGAAAPSAPAAARAEEGEHRAAAITGRAIFVGERRARRATRPRVGRCSAAK